MGFHDEVEDGSTGLSAEEKLSILARTPKGEFPEEFTQFHRTLSSSMNALNKSQNTLSNSEVFDCDAQERAQSCSDKIVQAVQGIELKQQFTDLQTYIARCNIAIDKAQNVWLPGDRLDAESERIIMDATEPLDMIVPGLGTVTGVMGVEGANLISKLLSGNREKEAEKKYNEIMDRIPERVKSKSVPRGEDGIADINGTWPDNSAESHDDEYDWSHSTGGTGGSSRGLGGTMAGLGVGTAAGLAARNAITGSGTSPLSTYTGGMQTNASHDSSGSGSKNGGKNEAGHSRKPQSSTPKSDGSGKNSSSDGMVYDPSTGTWIHKKDAMSVDSGMSGLHGAGAATGLGRTALAAGAGVGFGAGGTLAAGRLMGSGSSMGALSGAGGAGMASLSGAGIGSYYANEPVKATPVSSSIKGATGLAAGLRKGASASSAGGAASHGASPAMMGAGRGGSSGSEGKRRNTMGYIAPKIEDDEEFVPKPLAAMAGRRKRPGE